MMTLAKYLIIVGIAFVIVGGVFYLAARLGLSAGRIPGDIRIASGNMTCILGLGTSLLLSVVLTIILNIILRILNR